MALTVSPLTGGYYVTSSGSDLINDQTVAAILPGATLMGNDSIVLQANGIRTVFASAGNDTISGGISEGSAVDAGSGNDVLTLSALVGRPPSGTASIVQLGEGDDAITLNTFHDEFNDEHYNVRIYGGAGADTVNGSTTDGDWVYGGDGNDTIILGGTLSRYIDAQLLTHEYDVAFNRAYGDAGNDSITGGKGYDLVYGGAGDDVIHGGSNYMPPAKPVKGPQHVYHYLGDRLFGDAGKDTLYGEVGHDRLDGGADADKLYGGTGNDAIFGSTGNDLIVGGAGRDLLNGGRGRDIFVFDTSPKVSNLDTLTDFVVRDDTFQLDNAVYRALGHTGRLSSDAFVVGKVAQDAQDRIVYDKTSGRLFYDKDGVGGSSQIEFAHLTHRVALTHSDFYVI
ncbi:calcium-binding protein [Microvirga antarctica]|uniref:calcium-binding protein n=1 Tax=Microvirga antarctica TaxID=2819233 RepID=UPI001B3063C4|nr:calcium-binding protein [Microvirga antarctica]